ncbi:MAG: hypothetical protein KJ799_14930 [Bacteroidetes bacterium]|nr:hypothetical protein [Bacteroidota bacterium]MBU1680624.1 hypothetical protein [Bacteroidota bacterium]MBU2507999.1 hypothetical protein [Bacteroidota bacterium]
MLDTIFTIAFFALLFGLLGYFIYLWTKKIRQKGVADFGLKSSDKFGCH